MLLHISIKCGKLDSRISIICQNHPYHNFTFGPPAKTLKLLAPNAYTWRSSVEVGGEQCDQKKIAKCL